MRMILALSVLMVCGSVSAQDDIDAKIKQLQIANAEHAALISRASVYQLAKTKADANNGVLILWVGTTEDCRAVVLETSYGTPVSAWVKTFQDKPSGIHIVHPNGKSAILQNWATDAQIQAAVSRLEGIADAPPFSQGDYSRPYAQPDANPSATGPWLPQSEQDALRGMWPKGVPLPFGIRFYKLPVASQAVASLNVVNPTNTNPVGGSSRPFMYHFAGAENANREFPWKGSGGMDWAVKGTWRNVTGMALPQGKKIRVWTAPMRVSTQYEVGLHWDFPTGTQMFDVLVRKNDDGTEHIFNVRRRTKNATGWDDGASFLPDVQSAKEYVREDDTSGTRVDTVLGVSRIKYRFSWINPLKRSVRFKEASDTRIGMGDGGHFFPPGFVGTGLLCSKCHSPSVMEKQEYGGPLLRGKDTVFSWYPVRRSQISSSVNSADFLVPQLDYRWPIEFIGHYQGRYGE